MSSPPPSPLRMTLTVSTVANAFIKFSRARHDALDFASDQYVCKGAVDMVKLLRVSRASLLEKAVFLGANVLIEESWVCQIRIPKKRHDGKFRVLIRYYASASRSSFPDPQKPVALDKVTNVPGLMTIIRREEIAP